MTRPKKGILIIGILLIATIIITIIYNPESPGKKHSGTSSNKPVSKIAVSTFQKEDHWGYKVFLDTTLFIYQEFIPGLTGKQEFISEQQALNCGTLVREKLLKQKIPSITTRELDSLGITYTK